MTEVLDTSYQDTIVCPWCGYHYNQGDLFEYHDGEWDCIECEKPFELTTEMYRDFTTKKVEK